MFHYEGGSKVCKRIWNFRVDPAVTAGAICSFLESLDCPRSLAVWMLFREGEHQQLAELQFDPFAYNSVGDLRDAYAATNSCRSIVIYRYAPT